jgi:prepilin-type N-terminal cleavage/methylation domain-containing protein
MTHTEPSRATPPAARARKGFTLTEILIVIGIIVLMAALSVPAFNVISGSKSIQGATNIVQTMVSRARSEAMARGEIVGLAVYVDQTQQKTALALVGFAQPWTSGTSYVVGDYVYTDENGTRQYWICGTAHTAGSGATADQQPTYAFPSKNFYNWVAVDTSGSASPKFILNYSFDQYVSILPETDVTFLPVGVGAQVLNSARIPGNTGTAALADRYLQTSVIFFDKDGRLLPGQQWGIMYAPTNNQLSSRLGLLVQFGAKLAAGPTKTASTNTYNLDPLDSKTNYTAHTASGLGVILYDKSSWDAIMSNVTIPELQYDSQATGQQYQTPTGSSPPPQNEADKEQWLDQNGTLLLLNRYTGSLIKAE